VFKKDLNPFILIDKNVDPKYLLGIINSKLFSYLYLNNSAIATKDDFRQTTLSELRKMPIKIVKTPNECEYMKQIISNVEALLELNDKLKFTNLESKKQQLLIKIEYSENRINDIVYKLYELTQEEVNSIQNTNN
jgi:serine phosphatase RsbU (regulator of sigma subunit)